MLDYRLDDETDRSAQAVIDEVGTNHIARYKLGFRRLCNCISNTLPSLVSQVFPMLRQHLSNKIGS